MPIKINPIAQYIDHTLLDPTAKPWQVSTLCAEARQHKLMAVCINPYHVRFAVRELAGSGVLVATVVGFPLGANLTRVKAAETNLAIADGADEIDMVINIAALQAGDHAFVLADIQAVVAAACGKPVKVIIECDLLSGPEKVAATQLCIAANAAMVKTSTGFAKGGKGATVDDVALIKRTLAGAQLGIKASAGIRSYVAAVTLIEAGATRLGTSAGVTIVQEEAAALACS